MGKSTWTLWPTQLVASAKSSEEIKIYGIEIKE